jgi:hypothetical protein
MNPFEALGTRYNLRFDDLRIQSKFYDFRFTNFNLIVDRQSHNSIENRLSFNRKSIR